MNRDSANHFKAQKVILGQVEYYPISARDQSRLYQSGKKVLPSIFLGYVSFAMRFWKGDILVADIEDLRKFGRDRIHPRRLNAKEVLTQQRLTILSSQSQKEQQNCLEEITVSENTLQGGNNLQGAKISGKNFKETRRNFNRQKQKMTLKHSMTYKQ